MDKLQRIAINSSTKMLSSQFPNGQVTNLIKSQESPLGTRTQKLIAGTGDSSPYRQKNNRKGLYASKQKKQNLTLESKNYIDLERDSHPAVSSYYNEAGSVFQAGSPCNSAQGTRQHTRGYSLLNPPVNVANFDASGGEASDQEQTIEDQVIVNEQELQKDEPKAVALNRLSGKPLPDLLFRGYGVQPELVMTVE